MKITIEPTVEIGSEYYPTISVSTKSDELNVQQTMDLIQQALKTWGFSDKSIEDYFKE